MINGSCVATHPHRNPHGDYGQCANTTLPEGIVWAYDFCPTPHSWLAILGLVLYLMFFAPGKLNTSVVFYQCSLIDGFYWSNSLYFTCHISLSLLVALFSLEI